MSRSLAAVLSYKMGINSPLYSPRQRPSRSRWSRPARSRDLHRRHPDDDRPRRVARRHPDRQPSITATAVDVGGELVGELPPAVVQASAKRRARAHGLLRSRAPRVERTPRPLSRRSARVCCRPAWADQGDPKSGHHARHSLRAVGTRRRKSGAISVAVSCGPNSTDPLCASPAAGRWRRLSRAGLETGVTGFGDRCLLPLQAYFVSRTHPPSHEKRPPPQAAGTVAGHPGLELESPVLETGAPWHLRLPSSEHSGSCLVTALAKATAHTAAGLRPE